MTKGAIIDGAATNARSHAQNRLIMKAPFYLPALALLAACLFTHFAAAAPRNVVFILADDLGYGELGCYGQEKIRTLNIDQLAREGTRFTRHYTGAPVCAPARCVLMTGRHLGHAEIRGNRQARLSFPEFGKEGQHPISAAAPTIAMAFRAADFATGAMGKWGLGPVGSTGDPNKKGFDVFYGYNCQAAAHSFYPAHLWRNGEKLVLNKNPIPGHAKQPEGEVRMEEWIGEKYAPPLMLDAALGFIRDHKDRRFFLYLPFIEPHMAMHPPVELVNEYPEAWDERPYRGQSAYLPHPRPRAGYAAMITDLDRHVGAVVAELKKAGIYDQTLVVFTSDNGATHMREDPQFGVGGIDPVFFNPSGGLKGFKGSLHEGGIRVPTIARLPGVIAAGTVNNTPGYFADWFPTLAAATGIAAPANLDGENLWPDITGKATLKSRKPMVWVYPEYGGQVAVIMGDIKVLRRDLLTKKPQPWEVYDLAEDPTEENNLAATRRELIKRAVEILKAESVANEFFPMEIPDHK
jgi:arylsulfatase A-like enzyme